MLDFILFNAIFDCIFPDDDESEKSLMEEHGKHIKKTIDPRDITQFIPKEEKQ